MKDIKYISCLKFVSGKLSADVFHPTNTICSERVKLDRLTH